MLIFLYSHKVIHSEIEVLHGGAVLLATECTGDTVVLALLNTTVMPRGCSIDAGYAMQSSLFALLVIFPCCLLLDGGFDP